MLKSAMALVVGLAAGSPAVAALTAVQSVSFAGGEGTTVGSDSDGTVRASYETAITGLQKFDPSLGTLTRVLLSIEVDAAASVTLHTDDVSDAQSPFSLQHVDQAAETFVQTQLAYNYDGAARRFLAITSSNLGTTGGTGLDPADHGNPDFEYTDASNVVYGGFSNGGSTPRTGQVLATDDFYDASDFVGVGEVTTLLVVSFADIYLSPTSFTMENLGSATVTAFSRVESGNVTLQYEYTPIPEPASLALVGPMAALLIRGRGLRRS